jgi:hypothetical protein
MGWLLVVGDVTALRWIEQNERMAFRSYVKTGDVKPGDPFALYMTRGAYHNPTRGRSQILGRGTFLQAVTGAPAEVMGEVFPKSVSLRLDLLLPDREGMEFAPWVERMTFIKKKQAWAAYLRSTLVSIPDSDLEVLTSALDAFAPSGKATTRKPAARKPGNR